MYICLELEPLPVRTLAMAHGPPGRLVTVARFDYPYQAQLARTRLGDAGIPSTVENEDMTGLHMIFNMSLSGVKVKVPEDYYNKAEQLLDDLDLEAE
jgi:hypothetical protein